MLRLAANLHDICKISIDLNIITNPNMLSNEEQVAIITHPEVGARFVQAIPALQSIAEIILSNQKGGMDCAIPED